MKGYELFQSSWIQYDEKLSLRGLEADPRAATKNQTW